MSSDPISLENRQIVSARLGPSTASNPLLEFPPYASYIARTRSFDEFIQLTNVSYTLAQQLLFSTPRDQLSDVEMKDSGPEERSYSMADRIITSVTLSAGWLTYEAYAKHEGGTAEEIRSRAEAGELGEIQARPKDGASVILWPPEDKRSGKFRVPEIGKQTWAVTENLTYDSPVKDNFDLSNPEELTAARRLYLSLAHSLGEPDDVSKRATEILYRAMFLLQWTGFEIFLRETVEHLLAENPQVIIRSAGRKTSLSYEQIFDMSEKLSSMDDLRREMIELEVQKLRAGGRSVHGLINFLKSAFNFKDDPYKAWYVLKGQRRESSYDILLKVKDRRNALTHELGPSQGEAADASSVSEEEYAEAELVLRSIAYSIARNVYHKHYEVQDNDN